jgi:hypothetical protein
VWVSIAQIPSVVHLTWVGTLAAAAAVAAEDTCCPPHRELNVADAAAVSLVELTQHAAAAVGTDPVINRVDDAVYRGVRRQAEALGASRRAWFPFHGTPDYVLSVDRLATELGITPPTTAAGTWTLYGDYAAGRYSAGSADFGFDDLLAEHCSGAVRDP